MSKIIKKNKWAKVVKLVDGSYVTYAKSPVAKSGWVPQTDYTNRLKAFGVYKGLSR